MRIAFTIIGGKNWTGGYNYLLNLVSVLAEYEKGRVTPVLFFGTDIDKAEAASFAAIAGVEVVHSPLMNQARKTRSLLRAILFGVDAPARDLFHKHRIDVVFESAVFFGRRLDLPAIAWVPDLQHRALRHMFSRVGYWKRELGFRAQVIGGRTIMLSSEDSRRACEHFYPTTVGRTRVVRFAVPAGQPIGKAEARAIADGYGLPEHFFFMPNQFWQHKNHLLVLDALALMRERGKSVVIAVSGKQADPRNPAYFSQVQRKFAQLGLDKEFRLLGMIPREHLSALICACTAVLNPSTFEGWSTTVEEARSLGVPMVLSDLDVHREQVGDDAIFFDRFSAAALADALQRGQVADGILREDRIQFAQADAERRVRRFAEDFVQLLEQSLSPKKG
jgi:glycosyltransferase involved in cell wall biosynthesis